MPLYIKLKKRKIDKAVKAGLLDPNINPQIVPLMDTPIETGDILDSLNIKLECCRAHVISMVTFYDYYGY